MDAVKVFLLVVIMVLVGVFVFNNSSNRNAGEESRVIGTQSVCPTDCNPAEMAKLKTWCPNDCDFAVTSNGTVAPLGASGTSCSHVDYRNNYSVTYGVSDGKKCVTSGRAIVNFNGTSNNPPTTITCNPGNYHINPVTLGSEPGLGNYGDSCTVVTFTNGSCNYLSGHTRGGGASAYCDYGAVQGGGSNSTK